MKKRICRVLSLSLFLCMIFDITAEAQTDNKEQYIEYCESISECFNIQAEFVEAVCFYESSWRADVVSDVDCVGLMQVNPKIHKDRMTKYGVTDLYDPYSNILVGTDYLAELFEKYDDPYAVLMVYNMGNKGIKLYNDGVISDYAKKVCDYAQALEVENGK